MFDRKLLFAVLLASLSEVAAAQVPHVFAPNTPAKATEVNDNFQHLLNLFQTQRNHIHRHQPDCTTLDENGNRYCDLASTGGDYDESAPWTVVTTATLPAGEYLVLGRVSYWLRANLRNPWLIVQCELRDDVSGTSLDRCDVGSTSTVEAATGIWADGVSSQYAPITMFAADTMATSGGTVSLRCRVQGQAGQRDTSTGAYTWPVAITGVRVSSAKISAVQVGAQIMQPPVNR